MPLTGRTHQLRAHMAAIETPIVGDGKYGKEPSRSHGEIPNRLMLHARSLRIRHPKGHYLDVTAPLPPHMAKVWDMFGFDKNDKRDPFRDWHRKTGHKTPRRPRVKHARGRVRGGD